MLMTNIHAEIIGSDRCEAAGITVRAAAPVLAMCRKLLAAGYDPDRPLHAYRGDALALKVRTIGEGAKLTVEESRSPRFRPLEAVGAGGGVAQDRAERGERYQCLKTRTPRRMSTYRPAWLLVSRSRPRRWY